MNNQVTATDEAQNLPYGAGNAAIEWPWGDPGDNYLGDDVNEDSDELVDERWGCPNCCERDMDWLICGTDESDDEVTCWACGTVYTIEFGMAVRTAQEA